MYQIKKLETTRVSIGKKKRECLFHQKWYTHARTQTHTKGFKLQDRFETCLSFHMVIIWSKKMKAPTCCQGEKETIIFFVTLSVQVSRWSSFDPKYQ